MIRVKVNGRTLFNGDAGEWVNRPPTQFQDMIKPGAKPAPWMKAIGVVLADALVLNSDMRINVVTKFETWTMTVES